MRTLFALALLGLLALVAAQDVPRAGVPARRLQSCDDCLAALPEILPGCEDILPDCPGVGSGRGEWVTLLLVVYMSR